MGLKSLGPLHTSRNTCDCQTQRHFFKTYFSLRAFDDPLSGNIRDIVSNILSWGKSDGVP